MLHRAKLDKNTGLKNYCEALEKVVVETVESGIYTKDLAISVTGNNQPPRSAYVNTVEFIESVRLNLEKKINWVNYIILEFEFFYKFI